MSKAPTPQHSEAERQSRSATKIDSLHIIGKDMYLIDQRNKLKNHSSGTMIQLRGKELFPQPVDFGSWWSIHHDEIPKEVMYGSVIDLLYDKPCGSCKRNKIPNYAFSIVCNICGSIIRASKYEKMSILKNHMKKHGAPNDDNLDTCGVYDIEFPQVMNYRVVQSLQILVHARENSCAKCVMCGCDYDSEIIDDSVIKIHVERCKRIIELRTRTKTMPTDLVKPHYMPPDKSMAYLPLDSSHRDTCYKSILNHVNRWRNCPLADALVEIKMCEYCAEPIVKCRICNVRILSKDLDRNILEIAFIHLTDNPKTKTCSRGLIDSMDNARNRGASAAEVNDIIKKITSKSNKYMIELISKLGCVICGGMFDGFSTALYKNHMKTHENDGTNAPFVRGF